MKCLLLYASFGDGHVQVARALTQVLESEYAAEVICLDSFRNTSPFFARFNEWIYESTTRYASFLYGWSYDWTRWFSSRHVLWKCLSVFSRRAAWTAVRLHQPEIVIQLFPDHALATWPSLSRVPFLAVVLTDFSIHSRWFHQSVDLYALPTESALGAASPFLEPSAKWEVTGIPIRPQFASCSIAQRLIYPTIVISAGGRGVFPDVEDVLKVLFKQFPSHRVAVLCGRNGRMAERVRSYALSLDDVSRLHAIDYTPDVAMWLQQATFVVAKSGGISIAECLASGTPMIFYRPQPGQECHNAQCIKELGAGRIARNIETLDRALAEMTPERIMKMQQACVQYSRPFAAGDVADAIVQAWRDRGRCEEDSQGQSERTASKKPQTM